jgi:DNA-binding NarL/FixJ family response regulator
MRGATNSLQGVAFRIGGIVFHRRDETRQGEKRYPENPESDSGNRWLKISTLKAFSLTFCKIYLQRRGRFPYKRCLRGGYKFMRNPRKSNVLIVDAEPVARCGLLHIINSHADLRICAEADSLPAARAACERWKPEVVVLDVALGGGEGFAFVKELPRWNANLCVVAFTGLEDTASVQRALRAGACGYVTRRDPVTALLGAIVGGLAGERHLGPRAEHMLLETLAMGRVQMEDDDLTLLSERERQVYRLIGEGLRTRAVAAELHLSVKTVETHRQRIKEKLHLQSGAELQHRAAVFHATGRGAQNGFERDSGRELRPLS